MKKLLVIHLLLGFIGNSFAMEEEFSTNTSEEGNSPYLKNYQLSKDTLGSDSFSNQKKELLLKTHPLRKENIFQLFWDDKISLKDFLKEIEGFEFILQTSDNELYKEYKSKGNIQGKKAIGPDLLLIVKKQLKKKRLESQLTAFLNADDLDVEWLKRDLEEKEIIKMTDNNYQIINYDNFKKFFEANK